MLNGIISVKGSATGFDVEMSCAVSMFDFWYLAPQNSPTTFCQWRFESLIQIQRDFSHEISLGLNRSLCTITLLYRRNNIHSCEATTHSIIRYPKMDFVSYLSM